MMKLYAELIKVTAESGTATPDTAPTAPDDVTMFSGELPNSAIVVEAAPVNRVHIFVKGSGWQTMISSDPI